MCLKNYPRFNFVRLSKYGVNTFLSKTAKNKTMFNKTKVWTKIGFDKNAMTPSVVVPFSGIGALWLPVKNIKTMKNTLIMEKMDRKIKGKRSFFGAICRSGVSRSNKFSVNRIEGDSSGKLNN